MYNVYIYDKNWNILTQIPEITKLEINFKINDLSSANFDIENNYVNYDYFQEFNLVKINKKIWISEEKEMFFWVVRWVKTSLKWTTIYLNDKLFLLKKKKLYIDKSYTNQSIYSILSDLVTHVNSRDSWFLTLNTNITTIIPEKIYRKGESLLNIITDLAWDIYEFNFIWNTLNFLESIWIDRSSWWDIVLLEFDKDSFESRNILNIEWSYDSDNIANAVNSAEDWEIEDSISITKYWRQEEYFSSWLKADLLSQRKDSINELDIEPMINDFFLCNVWDIIKVQTNTWNLLLDFNWNIKVIEKRFTSWSIDKVKFKINKWKVKSLDLFETIWDLRNRIWKLEL